jgi:hypothetical protein
MANSRLLFSLSVSNRLLSDLYAAMQRTLYLRRTSIWCWFYRQVVGWCDLERQTNQGLKDMGVSAD